MSEKQHYPTKEELRRMFEYDDGVLYWAVRNSNRIKIGDPLKTSGRGYARAGINGKKCQAHRLVWIYFNGDIPEGLQIDHINGDTTDNHIENLRLATIEENSWNKKWAKGYSWSKDKRKWIAQITYHRKTYHLGYYADEDEASAAYQKAKEKYHVFDNHQSEV